MLNRGRALALCCVLAGTWVGAPGLATAQPTAEPTPADRENARGLLDLGDKKAAAKDYEAALKAYRAADAIMHVPTTGIEVGRTELKLGLLVEGRDTLLRVARIPQKPGESDAFARARADALALAEQVGARIPSLVVQVSGPPAGTAVTVTVDGVKLAPELFGLPRKVNPGEHVIVAAAPGYVERKETVSVAEGAELPVTLELAVAAGGAPPVPDPKVPGPEPEPEPENGQGGGAYHPLLWVGVGLAAGGVVVGGITGGIALKRARDLRVACPDEICPPEQEDELATAKKIAAASTANFAIAGLGAVLAIIGGVLPRSAPEPTTGEWRIAPAWSGDTAGVRVDF
ncbi:MAG: hypothetical protein IT373_19020 [Polyangiaceae bacterium]|nr:hypothetical protein [Polyangiaceae bacterium]